LKFSKHKSVAALILAAWVFSTFVFSYLHSEQLVLLCSGLARPWCVRTALTLKPKLNKRLADFGGITPLIYCLDRAALNPEPRTHATLQILLQAGADPNLADEEGWSPLMIASSGGQLSLVKLLLESGAQVNKRAKARSSLDGMTALMAAAHHGHSKVIEYLISKGAKPEIQSSKGLNAATIAALERHENVVQILRQNGSEVDRETLQSLEMAEELEAAADYERSPASQRRPLRSRRPEE
jgi:ankyrin repeat protein